MRIVFLNTNCSLQLRNNIISKPLIIESQFLVVWIKVLRISKTIPVYWMGRWVNNKGNNYKTDLKLIKLSKINILMLMRGNL